MIARPARVAHRVVSAAHGPFRSPPRRLAPACLTVLLVAVGLIGCRALPIFQPESRFPNALVTDDGQEIHIATLELIAGDEDLDDAEKRQALEELGIVDEDIQDFILENF